MRKGCVYYFIGTNGETSYTFVSPYCRTFFYNPSECLWLIPGTYAQMLEDYE